MANDLHWQEQRADILTLHKPLASSGAAGAASCVLCPASRPELPVPPGNAPPRLSQQRLCRAAAGLALAFAFPLAAPVLPGAGSTAHGVARFWTASRRIRCRCTAAPHRPADLDAPRRRQHHELEGQRVHLACLRRPDLLDGRPHLAVGQGLPVPAQPMSRSGDCLGREPGLPSINGPSRIVSSFWPSGSRSTLHASLGISREGSNRTSKADEAPTCSITMIITSLEKAQAAGRLQHRLKILTHPALLAVHLARLRGALTRLVEVGLGSGLRWRPSVLI